MIIVVGNTIKINVPGAVGVIMTITVHTVAVGITDSTIVEKG